MNDIKSFIIKSNEDNLELHGLLIEAEYPKAIVQLSHGMCEHKERYIPFMKYLAKNNFTCIIHDHRGHGESVNSKDDLGYFYDNGGQALVKDLFQVTNYAKEAFPKLPLYLLGHSMGSLGVRAYIKENDSLIDGLIVSGSPSNNPLSKMAIAFDNLLIKFKGARYRSNLVNNLFFASFNKPFKSENLNNAWLTTDKDIVKKYNNDEYCNFIFTLNGFNSLLYLVNTVYDNNNWKVSNKDLPIKFISGENDPCLVNEKAFMNAVNLLKEVGYKNVSHRLFKGMRHEILNEMNKEMVYEDILKTLESWL